MKRVRWTCSLYQGLSVLYKNIIKFSTKQNHDFAMPIFLCSIRKWISTFKQTVGWWWHPPKKRCVCCNSFHVAQIIPQLSRSSFFSSLQLCNFESHGLDSQNTNFDRNSGILVYNIAACAQHKDCRRSHGYTTTTIR